MSPSNLFDLLCTLVPGQLASLFFKVNVPMQHLPGASATPADRIQAMLQWAQQQQRLDDVERVYYEVTKLARPVAAHTIDHQPETRPMHDPNATIPDNLFANIVAWITATLNTPRLRLEGPPVTDAQVQKAIAYTVGNDAAFGVFAALSGPAFMESLARPKVAPKTEYPANVAAVVAAFAAAWQPDTPRCDRCNMPAFVMRPTRTGVDRVTVGTVCPHCGDGCIAARPYTTSHFSWLKARMVPLSERTDSTTDPGAVHPIAEDELRDLTHADTLVMLDKAGLPVSRWAHWLRSCSGAGMFDSGTSPRAVLKLLKSDVITGHGRVYVQGKVTQAVNEMGAVPGAGPRGGGAHVSTAQAVRLDQSIICDIHAAAIKCGYAKSRDTLLSGLDAGYTGSLPDAADRSAQILSDLNAINGVALTDGTVPLANWLGSAVLLAGPRMEADTFTKALAMLSAPTQATRPLPSTDAICKAIVSGFGNEDAMRQMVVLLQNDDGSRMNLETIVRLASVGTMAFDLTNWMEARGRLADLVSAMKQKNGGNPKVAAL